MTRVQGDISPAQPVRGGALPRPPTGRHLPIHPRLSFHREFTRTPTRAFFPLFNCRAGDLSDCRFRRLLLHSPTFYTILIHASRSATNLNRILHRYRRASSTYQIYPHFLHGNQCSVENPVYRVYYPWDAKLPFTLSSSPLTIPHCISTPRDQIFMSFFHGLLNP